MTREQKGNIYNTAYILILAIPYHNPIIRFIFARTFYPG